MVCPPGKDFNVRQGSVFLGTGAGFCPGPVFCLLEGAHALVLGCLRHRFPASPERSPRRQTPRAGLPRAPSRGREGLPTPAAGHCRKKLASAWGTGHQAGVKFRLPRWSGRGGPLLPGTQSSEAWRSPGGAGPGIVMGPRPWLAAQAPLAGPRLAVGLRVGLGPDEDSSRLCFSWALPARGAAVLPSSHSVTSPSSHPSVLMALEGHQHGGQQHGDLTDPSAQPLLCLGSKHLAQNG